MVEIKLNKLLSESESVDAFIKFREIEDWCVANVPSTLWKFKYSPPICVAGIDVPGSIIFKNSESASAFKIKFSK